MNTNHEPAERKVQCDTQEFCSCGTNEHLCVTGFSLVFRFEGRPAWAVTCFECKEEFLIDDDGRDELFGTGWRESKEQA